MPVFVDCEPDTYCVDVDRIEEMITPTAPARSSFPNLIGNAPDWDAHRATIADRHGLPVIEDSCDTLGATLRGTPDRRALDDQRHQLRQLAHHHRAPATAAW